MTKVFIKATCTYTPKNKLQKGILEELSKLDCILCNHQNQAVKLIIDAYISAVNNYAGKAVKPDLKKFNPNKDTLTYHVDEVIYLSIYSVRTDYTSITSF